MRLCAIGDISTSVYFAETFLKFLTRTGIVSDRLNKYREKKLEPLRFWKRRGEPNKNKIFAGETSLVSEAF